uniref:Uncharacterized protein n=1 Tax=Rhizophora mucronata TaxID=61149 RepID=A0A2P2PGW1_RHIMU
MTMKKPIMLGVKILSCSTRARKDKLKPENNWNSQPAENTTYSSTQKTTKMNRSRIKLSY